MPRSIFSVLLVRVLRVAHQVGIFLTDCNKGRAVVGEFVEAGALGRSGNNSGFFRGIDDQKAPRLRVAGGRGELCCLDAANQLFFGWTLLRVVVAAAFTLFDQLEKIRHKKAPFKLFYAVWQKKIVDTAGKQFYFRRKKQRCQAKKEKGESGENCTKREVLFLLSSAS